MNSTWAEGIYIEKTRKILDTAAGQLNGFEISLLKYDPINILFVEKLFRRDIMSVIYPHTTDMSIIGLTEYGINKLDYVKDLRARDIRKSKP